jgi:hypothetical protein
MRGSAHGSEAKRIIGRTRRSVTSIPLHAPVIVEPLRMPIATMISGAETKRQCRESQGDEKRPDGMDRRRLLAPEGESVERGRRKQPFP